MTEATGVNGGQKPIADIEQIMQRIPHRYPFLLVDRLVELVPFESAVAIKAVSAAEPHFQGHFPGHPIMPGVLIVESMAQTAALMVISSLDDAEGSIVYLMSVDKAKFRRPVTPGDMMRICVSVIKKRSSVWKFSGRAVVDGSVVAEAEFSAMLRKEEAAK